MAFTQLRSFHEDRFGRVDAFLGLLADRAAIEQQYALALNSLAQTVHKTVVLNPKSDDVFDIWAMHFARSLEIKSEHFRKFAKELTDARETTMVEFVKRAKGSFANVCRDLTGM